MKEVVEIISLIMGVVIIALVVRYAGGVSQIVSSSSEGLDNIINSILGNGGVSFGGASGGAYVP